MVKKKIMKTAVKAATRKTKKAKTAAASKKGSGTAVKGKLTRGTGPRKAVRK